MNPDAYDHEYGGIANGNGGNVFEYLDFREITDEEIEFIRAWTGAGSRTITHLYEAITIITQRQSIL